MLHAIILKIIKWFLHASHSCAAHTHHNHHNHRSGPKDPNPIAFVIMLMIIGFASSNYYSLAMPQVKQKIPGLSESRQLFSSSCWFFKVTKFGVEWVALGGCLRTWGVNEWVGNGIWKGCAIEDRNAYLLKIIQGLQFE